MIDCATVGYLVSPELVFVLLELWAAVFRHCESGWRRDWQAGRQSGPFGSNGPQYGPVCDIIWGMLQRERPPLFPVGLKRWASNWGTGKSPPWGFDLRNTGRPGHSQCLCLGKELNQTSHRGPYRGWNLGVVPTATTSSSQWSNLLFGKVSFTSQLVCPSVLWWAEGQSRPKLSLGQRIKGESRVPSPEVKVKTAEGTNSQGQLCPADSVLQRAALWWPDKEVGGQEGYWPPLWNHSQQADLLETARRLYDREFLKDQASGDLSLVWKTVF